MAALGWAVSLYFGFFRYRQYVWSRNKVRYDLLQKIDRRRSDLAAKLLMLCEISTEARPRKARISMLLRQYLALMRQINFYQNEGVFSEAILAHLRAGISKDLGEILNRDNELSVPIREWLEVEATPNSFTSTLTFEQQHK